LGLVENPPTMFCYSANPPSHAGTLFISARRHANHKVDVHKYRQYYLLLEKAVGYYMDYQLSQPEV
jgi:hypothetical protein